MTTAPARNHDPTFSCVYPGPIDAVSLGQLCGPDVDDREAFRLVSMEDLGDGRTRAYFEPIPMARVSEVLAERTSPDDLLAQSKARAFWLRE